MNDSLFYAPDGTAIPAITAEQMREVDRVAMEEFGLGILQMMENAGRNLALHAMDMLEAGSGKNVRVVVLAGSGGNGGGGLCCARHLHNRGLQVEVALSKEPDELAGATRAQLDILQAAGVRPLEAAPARDALSQAQLVIDALIGYSLRGAPRGQVAEWIELCNTCAERTACRVLSLDVPSGLNATSGETPGAAVRPDRTLTLALPKTGLRDLPGELYLADIGITPEVYDRIGLSVPPLFGRCYWLRLRRPAP